MFDELYDSSFLSNTARYGGPLRAYALGRYLFSVPEELKEKEVNVLVYPLVPENVTESYRTESFAITEFPWKTQDHEKEFEAAWRSLREEEKNSFAAREYRAEGYAENLDASELFGRPAVCIAYDQSFQPAPIKTFIALPQGIVCFEERRKYYKTMRGTELEAPALKIFQAYSWGKSRDDRPDTFYTRLGRLNGYATRNESPSFWCMDDSTKYRLNFWTYAPGPPRPKTGQSRLQEERAGITRKTPPGFSMSNLRTATRTMSDINFVEYIDKYKMPNSDTFKLLFCLRSPEYAGTVERPFVYLEFRAPWVGRERAMLLWNSVLADFHSVSYFLSRM
ncbi:MAG: hypothetical protein LBQ63_04945 [Deltaproteobacteria bacterium]|jgi:hypothetical protein|nr:hypothetical protein [Deltaproteobacteria bacterium]